MVKVLTDGNGKVYFTQGGSALLGNDMGDDTVIATGSTEPRTLANRFADVINVKDFGAVGDGVTDDTAAFSSASQKGRVLLLPQGTYKLSAEPTWGKPTITLWAPFGDVSFAGWGLLNISAMKNTSFRLVHEEESYHGLNIRNIYTDEEENTGNGINSEIYSFANVNNENHDRKHWGIVGVVRTKSKKHNSEAVGVYGQTWRQSSNAMNPVWGGVFEARDTSQDGSPSGVVGMEVDCVSDGDCSDKYYNRVGVHVVGFSQTGEASTTNRLGSAIRLDINDHSTRWRYGIEITKDYDYGIWCKNDSVFREAIADFSNASFYNNANPIAIRIGNTHKISFDSSDSIYLAKQQNNSILNVGGGSLCINGSGDTNGLYLGTDNKAIVHRVSGSGAVRLTIGKGTETEKNYNFTETLFGCPVINIGNKLTINGDMKMAYNVTVEQNPNRYFVFSFMGTNFYIPAYLEVA